ncbi:MAG TPA: NAD(P)-dependent oxidoreductase [Flavobacteriales bacterium]|nr:NAD(P)-dependent oxidoreductase [Flavobacteriales bacterium]HRE75652.1 SDR family NAD(P)-dependent oxidoreductase [Flavobacteriales bacterium]HRJ36098.1 SDR family NAD(P)-dependent oxidoreductase [Flavobacteriales bacterium]HRJ39970.1 SDR family NAD(P)-dependent oxidoreductase [Flavobacteriales bacterium]
MKTILITGATSGFGKAIATLFASNGWKIIITGRREERLLNLQEALRKKYGVEVLALNFDIRNRDLTLNELSNLPKEFANVDVLVNNAGLALGLSSIDEGDVDEWEQMIDTNVKGMLYAIRAIAPGMRARKSGHIINIGSTAGKEAYKNGNVYCATKHAVEAITKGTRADLLPYNVKVTSVCPGMAETEFSEVRFSGDTNRAKQVYQGFEPLRPEDIAEVVYFAATRPAHVCLNDVILTPTAQANSFYTERNN